MNDKDNRDRLLRLKKQLGSYQRLAEHLGIPNRSYVSKYILHGKIPSNRKYSDALGIVLPKLNYTRIRNKGLDERAQLKGWDNWSAFETDVYKDVVEIPHNKNRG